MEKFRAQSSLENKKHVDLTLSGKPQLAKQMPDKKAANKKKALTKANSAIKFRPANYKWHLGGRLKELKYRNLARKFLYLWQYKTFKINRIHACHLPFANFLELEKYRSRKIISAIVSDWRVFTWENSTEWRLEVRADFHYHFNLKRKVTDLLKNYWQQRKDKEILQKSKNLELQNFQRRQIFSIWLENLDKKRSESSILYRFKSKNYLENSETNSAAVTMIHKNSETKLEIWKTWKNYQRLNVAEQKIKNFKSCHLLKIWQEQTSLNFVHLAGEITEIHQKNLKISVIQSWRQQIKYQKQELNLEKLRLKKLFATWQDNCQKRQNSKSEEFVEKCSKFQLQQNYKRMTEIFHCWQNAAKTRQKQAGLVQNFQNRQHLAGYWGGS